MRHACDWLGPMPIQELHEFASLYCLGSSSRRAEILPASPIRLEAVSKGVRPHTECSDSLGLAGVRCTFRRGLPPFETCLRLRSAYNGSPPADIRKNHTGRRDRRYEP